MPDNTKLTDIKIFSTWYPSEYKLPYLMSDRTYMMQCIHQNVGYNQPNHVGAYYLGTDMDFDKVPLTPANTPIGDIDGDGTLTLADITTLISLYLDTQAATNAAADIDGDGEITVSDITQLIKLYLTETTAE